MTCHTRREQDWHLRYKKDGGFFVTDRRVNDPSGLIRTSNSPGSPSGPSPRTAGSPYASSLRSTHVAGEGDKAAAEGTTADPASSTGAAGEAVSTPITIGASSLPPAFGGIDTHAAAGPSSATPKTSAPAPNPPPDLSFAFPDSSFDNLSFNPTLNFGIGLDGSSTPASGASSTLGFGAGAGAGPGGAGVGVGGVGGSGGDGFGGMGGPSFLGGTGDAAAFDPFGFATDGTPAMLPDSLFDWAQWQNFADSLGLPQDGKTPSAGAESASRV